MKRTKLASFFVAALLAPLAPCADDMPPSSRLLRLEKQIRQELARLPFYGVFDLLQYRVEGDAVVLARQVTRPTLKDDAERLVRNIEGVSEVINQIEVLPLSPMDDRIRLAAFKAIYIHSLLNRYALDPMPPIRIVVRDGAIALEGEVLNEAERDVAFLAAQSVPGVFQVTNNLRVAR